MRNRRFSKVGITTLVAISLLIGCGSSDDGPVYDTTANPFQLPQMALSLLDSLENDKLVGLADVTAAFGDLYTSHGELLDRGDWKQVIQKLGPMFNRKADSLTELGLNSLTIAAEYHLLASFARPDSQQFSYNARSFGAWMEVNNDTSQAMQQALLTMRTDLNSALIVSKPLLSADSAAFQFYHRYLKQPLKESLQESGQLTQQKMSALKRPERALARACEFTHDEPKPLASFLKPDIDLLAGQIDSIGEQTYKIELYFVAHEEVETDITIGLNISTEDSTRPEFSQSLQYTPVEIIPEFPATSWPRNQVVIVQHRLVTFSPPSQISVGLFDNSGEAGRYLTVDGHDGNHIEVKF